MLQMDLIDAAGDTPGAEDDDEEEERAARRPGAGPPEAEPRQETAPRGQSQGQGQGQGGGDTYRPKRPTTLNLFPQVPRSQVRRGRGCGAGLRQVSSGSRRGPRSGQGFESLRSLQPGDAWRSFPRGRSLER